MAQRYTGLDDSFYSQLWHWIQLLWNTLAYKTSISNNDARRLEECNKKGNEKNIWCKKEIELNDKKIKIPIAS